MAWAVMLALKRCKRRRGLLAILNCWINTRVIIPKAP